jgi:hypothetical protein
MKFLQSIGTCVLALSSLVSAASFSNPLKQKDGSDPHIAWSGGYYYMMTTTWTNLSITRAKTLGGLKTGETKVVWTDSNPDLNYTTLMVLGTSTTPQAAMVSTTWIFSVLTCSRVRQFDNDMERNLTKSQVVRTPSARTPTSPSSPMYGVLMDLSCVSTNGATISPGLACLATSNHSASHR